MFRQIKTSPTQIQIELRDREGALYGWLWLTSNIPWSLVEKLAPEQVKVVHGICDFDLRSVEMNRISYQLFLDTLGAAAKNAIMVAEGGLNG